MFIFFNVFNHRRKKSIIEKIESMTYNEKCEELNFLVEPFGYSYDCQQDIFSTTINAWQKQFGYTTLYDAAAPHFNMTFDCEPIYFNYEGKTWLIEFWKGQYGINAGGEIGIYHADSIIPEQNYKLTLFQQVTDDEMLPFSIEITHKDKKLGVLNQKHWWLTIFSMGDYAQPKNLLMNISITFPDVDIRDAFCSSLQAHGYSFSEISIFTISFTFKEPSASTNFLDGVSKFWAQVRNKFLCEIYLFLTRSFDLSVDRLLYLYFYLPPLFRKVIDIRKFKA